jgi:hypothetical protein
MTRTPEQQVVLDAWEAAIVLADTAAKHARVAKAQRDVARLAAILALHGVKAGSIIRVSSTKYTRIPVGEELLVEGISPYALVYGDRLPALHVFRQKRDGTWSKKAVWFPGDYRVVQS